MPIHISTNILVINQKHIIPFSLYYSGQLGDHKGYIAFADEPVHYWFWPFASAPAYSESVLLILKELFVDC